MRGHIRHVADVIAHVADEVVQAYREGRVVDEPHITDRFLGGVEAIVNTMREHDGLASPKRWQAKTLRASSGSAAEEKRYGADLLGVLTIQIPDYNVAKGFLAQAKRAEPGLLFSAREWDRLQGQCDAMEKVTHEAFVLVYSRLQGMRFIPSGGLRGLTRKDLLSLPSMPPRAFFERHFQCFIGDHRVNRPSVDALEAKHVHLDDFVGQPRNVLALSVSKASS
jgi:hypothetical protein